MATIKTTYVGGLRTEAIHIKSGAKIITDAPLDNHGKGESFSPTDLVCAGLGSCMLTIIGISSNTHGFNIEGTEMEITKTMSADPRRIAEIRIEFNFPMDYTDKQKKIIEGSAHACPVGHSLHPETIQVITFNYKNND